MTVAVAPAPVAPGCSRCGPTLPRLLRSESVVVQGCPSVRRRGGHLPAPCWLGRRFDRIGSGNWRLAGGRMLLPMLSVC